jgi:SAM-dependent methyltransferase
MAYCILCGGNHLKELQHFAHAFLVKCRDCGFVFSKKKPSDEELLTYYNNYPQSESISPITVKRYEDLLDSFEKYRKTNNLLDIGFGDGHLLDVAKKKGWNIYGTEYSETLARKGITKGFNVKTGKFQKDWFVENTFDVIIYIEVLEHINNPKEELPLYINILRDGGIFYLTTPNFNSLSRRLLKDQWSIVEYPEHLCYYTPATLKRMFNQFASIHIHGIATTGLSLSRMTERTREKRQASKEFNSYPADEKLRAYMEHSPAMAMLKSAANFFLNLFQCGDTMKVGLLKNDSVNGQLPEVSIGSKIIEI